MAGKGLYAANPAAPPYSNGPYTWDQDLTISGTLTLVGATAFTGTHTQTGDMNITGNLDVNGNFTFGDAVTDTLSVTGRLLVGTFATNIPVTTTYNYPVGIFGKVEVAQTASGTMRGLYVRQAVAANSSGGASIYGATLQLKFTGDCTISGGGETAAVWAYLECDSSKTIVNQLYASAIQARIDLGTGTTVTYEAAGIAVETGSASGATISGDYSGIVIRDAVSGGGSKDFAIGLKIDDSCCTTGIDVGACTTGILLNGAITTAMSITATSMTDAIKISGTTPVDGIEVSSACSANAINISGTSLVGLGIVGSTTGVKITGTTATTLAVQIGTWVSATKGSLIVNNTNKRQFDLCVDDNDVGTAGAAFISAGRARLLCTGTSYLGEQYTWQAVNKYVGSTLSSYGGGSLSTCEWATSFTVNGYAFGAGARLGGGAVQATIGSGGILAGFLSMNNMASAHTSSGVTAAFASIITSTENWDYGLYLNDASCDTGISIGTCTTGMTIAACTNGINLTGALTRGINFASGTLDTTATQGSISALSIGKRAGTALTLTYVNTRACHFDPIQMNIDIAGANPNATSTMNLIYQNITHTTTAMSNLRIKGADWTVTCSKDVKDIYMFQGEVDFTANTTVSGEVAGLAISMTTAATSVVTGNVWGAILMTSFTSAVSVSASLFISHRAGTLSHGIYFEPLGGTTITNLLYLNNAGTVTNFITATTESGAIGATRASPNQTAQCDGSLKVLIGAKTLYIPLYNAINLT